MNGLYTADEIYRLLPQVYRARDEEHGLVLRELVDLITSQINVLAESLDQMYDDQFVETAADWLAPYIGDLIGYRTLYGVVPTLASTRAEVANTIRYRRRKGTIFVVEQLAADVTGWPARAVEFLELLATTQYMNHVRSRAAATTNLRSQGRLELSSTFQAGAFDEFAHTAEMRRIATGAGRYNIPNIGIFLWRVDAIRLVRSPLVAADASGLRYRFDPLGTDKQLFLAQRTEEEITHLAQPLDVPLPLTRRFTKTNLGAIYGPNRTFVIETQGTQDVERWAAADVRICDLSDDPAAGGAWANLPAAADTYVAVDPVLGRIAFPAPPAAEETRLATFHYGSALHVGGGGYDRSKSLGKLTAPVIVAGGGGLVTAALAAVVGGGAVQISDSRRYTLPPSITLTNPAAGTGHVVVRSANRARPLLTRGDQIRLQMGPNTTLELDGVVISGAPLVIEETADTDKRRLILRHCTLVPGITRDTDGSAHSVGRASLIVLHPFSEVVLDHCVVGPIVAVEGAQVRANDSVIDASAEDQVAYCGRAEPAGGGLRTVSSAADRDVGDGLEPGGNLSLEACTVLGKLHAQRMDVSNSLLLARLTAADPWPAPVWAMRRQAGCMRFSLVPPGSRTARRYRCAGDDPRHRALHTSRRFGDPGYMQLRPSTHEAIRLGASDEGEMGVTHELYQPQRETNLRVRLDEYLRFGLEAGFFYAT